MTRIRAFAAAAMLAACLILPAAAMADDSAEIRALKAQLRQTQQCWRP